MKPDRSLGGTLSAWLALQGLAGLTVVCVAAYLVTAWALADRQATTLLQKRFQIEHVLADAEAPVADPELQHRIQDVLVGREDLSLVLSSAGGAPVFSAGRPRVAAGQEIFFEARAGAGTMLRAQLLLDTRDDEALLRRLGLTLAAAALVGTALVSAGGYLLVRRGLAPVRHLVDQTRELAADTLHRRLDGSRQPRELSALIDQINDLLGRLEAAYLQLEGFNADVAHELGTPLATLIGTSELALRHRRGAEELREVLGSNLEDLQRMAGIVQDMLFLSQADRGARARRTAVTSLAALAERVAGYYEAALADAGLSVDVTGDAAGAFDMPLLARALSNLLANAIRHATPGTSVSLAIAVEAGGGVKIQVINLGEAIPPLALPRLFDRFYRADAARSHAALHHGLGLAIVAAIARMHGGTTLATSHSGTTAIGMVLPAQAPQERPLPSATGRATLPAHQETHDA